MDSFNLFLETQYLENSVRNYLIFIGSIVLGLLFKGLISRYLSRSLYSLIGKKEKRVGVEKFDELLTSPIAFFIMLSVLFFGASYLKFPSSWDLANIDEFGIKMIVSKSFSLIYIYSIFRIVLKLVDYIGLKFRHKSACAVKVSKY